MDAGCASSIEAIESGEAHAPELAQVATLEFRLGAWILSSRHRRQGHSTGSKSAGPSALSVGHNVGKRDSPVRAALGLSKRPIATALRVVGLLVSTRASIARVAKICRQPGCDGGSGWPSRRLLSVRHAKCVVSSQLPLDFCWMSRNS